MTVERSTETTDSLIKIRDCFEHGNPTELGRVRNDLISGVLRELIARRQVEDQLTARVAKYADRHPLEIAAEDFKVALGKLVGELQAMPEGGALPPAAVGALMDDVDRLVTTAVMQAATTAGKSPEGPETPQEALARAGARGRKMGPE